jgi:endonuclease-3
MNKLIQQRKERMGRVLPLLKRAYPKSQCSLAHKTPLQLIVATILSAQCTDERVNKVTPALFARYPSAQAYAAANIAELEELIRTTGFFHNKAKSIKAMAESLVAEHGGDVPRTMEALTELAGVGRKTANVVLGNAFALNVGIVVDTHVTRLAQRLGFTRHTDAVKIEQDLLLLVPQNEWTLFSHLLIDHGRAICTARKPACPDCPLQPHCPGAAVFMAGHEAAAGRGKRAATTTASRATRRG